MSPFRLTVVLVALAGCSPPPAAIRNDGAVDGGGSAGAGGLGGSSAGGTGGEPGAGGLGGR